RRRPGRGGRGPGTPRPGHGRRAPRVPHPQRGRVRRRGGSAGAGVARWGPGPRGGRGAGCADPVEAGLTATASGGARPGRARAPQRLGRLVRLLLALVVGLVELAQERLDALDDPLRAGRVVVLLRDPGLERADVVLQVRTAR